MAGAVGRAGGPAGTSSAPRWPRSCSASASRSTAAAATSSSPTTRTRRPRRAAPHDGAELAADLDARRDAPDRRGQDGQVASATSRSLADALGALGPRRARPVLQHGPLPPAAGLHRRRARRRRSGPSRGCASSAAGSPTARRRPSWRRHRERVLRRAGRRLRHARGAGRALGVGPRGQRPRDRGERSAARTSPRCSSVLGLENLLGRRGGGRPDAAAQDLLRRRQDARAARDWAEADRLRDELRRRAAGRSATAPAAAAELGRRAAVSRASTAGRRGRTPAAPTAGGAAAAPRDRRGEVLYGRNPVREALRAGRRRVHRVWATAGRRASRGWPGSTSRSSRPTSRRARRHRRPPGPVRRRLALPVRRRAALLARRRPAGSSPSTRSRTPRTSARSAARAECAGADGVVLPRAALGRGDAGGRPRRRPGAVEHLAVARVRNLADFLADGARRRAAGPTAPRRRRRRRLRRARLRRRRRPRPGRRGARACARASRAPATSSWPCRCAGASRRSTSPPRRPSCCTRSCSAARPLDKHSITVGECRHAEARPEVEHWLTSEQQSAPGEECATEHHPLDPFGEGALVARLSTKSQGQVQVDDGYLIALAKQGDPTAYDRIVRRYYGFVRLKASSYFLAGGDSDDLIQEGLVGLYKAIRDYRSDRESSFRNFAELCITRQIITAVKTATRNKHTPLNQYVSFSSTPAARRRRRADARRDASRARPCTTRSTRSSAPRSCARSSRACRRRSPSSSRACSRSTSTATATRQIGERLGCDTKTVDNALQRVKRKVGAHLALPQRPAVGRHARPRGARSIRRDHRRDRHARGRRAGRLLVSPAASSSRRRHRADERTLGDAALEAADRGARRRPRRRQGLGARACSRPPRATPSPAALRAPRSASCTSSRSSTGRGRRRTRPSSASSPTAASTTSASAAATSGWVADLP